MMGCGVSKEENSLAEINLIHRVCLLIENKNPTIDTIWEILKYLPDRNRKLWNGCWSTPLGKFGLGRV